ncbi:MAG: hypothetical protein QGG95_00385 [Nitrospinota bacterium]|nr:hypothetical protein [Nitrospinota bacterium]
MSQILTLKVLGDGVQPLTTMGESSKYRATPGKYRALCGSTTIGSSLQPKMSTRDLPL